MLKYNLESKKNISIIVPFSITDKGWSSCRSYEFRRAKFSEKKRKKLYNSEIQNSLMLSNVTEDNPVTVQSTAEETTVTTLEPPVEETTVTTLDPNSALQNAQPTHPPEFLARDDNINEGKISR